MTIGRSKLSNPFQNLKAATTLCYLSSNSGSTGWLNYICSGILLMSDPTGPRQGLFALLSLAGPLGPVTNTVIPEAGLLVLLCCWGTQCLLQAQADPSENSATTPGQFLCRTDTDFPPCRQLLCPAWAHTILPAAAAEGEDPSPEQRAVPASAAWIPKNTISSPGSCSTALIHAGWAQGLFLKHRYWGSLSPCFSSPQVALQGKSHRSDYLGNSAFML